MRLLGGLYNKTKRSSFYLPEDNVFLGNIAFNLGYFYYSNKSKTLSESSAFTDFFINELTSNFYAVTGATDNIYQYTFLNTDDISTTYLTSSISVTSQDTAPSGMYFSSDGTKAYILGDTNNTIYQYTLTTAWDISTGSYASKSFSVGTQETAPTGLFFKSDGTKVYVVGTTNDSIYQYSLGTAWDISTATYENKSFYVGAYDTIPQGFFIGYDGTKLYLVGQGNSGGGGNIVYQFTLSTDWDISTAFSDLKISNITPQDSSPWGITFKSDGTKVYVAGDTNDSIYQYSLSIAWDISTLSYDNKKLYLGGFDTTNPSLSFKPDGTKLFVLGNSSDSIRSYTLTTAWDVSTAVYQLSGTEQDTTMHGITFSSDGTRCYLIGQTFDRVYQYVLSTAWDTNTAIYENKNFYIGTQETLPTGVTFNSDGAIFYIIGTNSDNIRQYTLTTPWDVSTASYASKTLNVGIQDLTPNDLDLSSDGSTAYMLGDTNNTIYQYTLTTPWDISTGSYASKSFSVNTQEASPAGMTFGDSGNKVYVVGISNDTIYQYGLTTPWDISTASYASKSLNVTTLEPNPQGISFSSDGSKCYVIGTTNNRVLKYNLSTAWDISTAIYESPERYVVPSFLGTDSTQLFFNDTGTLLYTSENVNDRVYQYKLSTAWNVSTAIPNRQTFLVSGQEAGANDLRFSSDGTKAYVSGLSTIFQYNLSSAWNISTATYASKSLSTSGQDTGSRGIAFKDDGTKVYMVGITNDSIYQYSLSTAWDISTGTYESKSLVVSGRENNPQAIYFNNDGTSVYVIGDTNDRIDQFNLSTAWDISTGSYASKTFTITQEGSVTALFFTPDGSGAYVLGTGFDTIYQYSLSIAWDIGSASYTAKSFAVGTLESTPTGLHFSSDGTICYILGQTGDTIQQFNLAVAWDISTANFGYLNISPQDTGLFSFCFNSTGTRLYALGAIADRIYQYNLPHAWNVGTAIFSSSVYIGFQDSSGTGIFLGNNGTRMFLIGGTNDNIYSYILNTPDEISSIYIPATSFTLDSTVTDITFNSSGDKFFTSGATGDVISEYSVVTPWDITTATNPSKSVNISSFNTAPTSLHFKSDGLKLYVVGTTPVQNIYELNMGSSYDISTTKTNVLNVGSQEGTVTGITFSSDGTKCYIVGTINDRIYQYNLSTAWDINTGIYSNKSFSVSSLDNTPTSLTFNDDGTRLYLTAETNDRIYEILLSTPWDLGTAGFRYYLSVSDQDTSPTDIVFGNNGFKLYLSGNTNDRVYEYNLTTAYDIRTASYSSNSVLTSALDTSTTGVFISSDGTHLYTTGDVADRVYQLKLTTPWDVSTAYSIFNRRVSAITQEDAPQGLAIGDSGTKMYIIGNDTVATATGNRIYQYTLSTPYNVSTATYANKSFNAGLFLADGCTSLEFNPTGTKVFVGNSVNDTIREYLLTTAWDVSTAKTPYSSKNIISQTGEPKDVFLGSNNTKAYVLSSANIVYQYTLSTASDITTATYDSKSFTASNYETVVTGISFKSDGTKLYATGSSSDRVGEFILSTPWDISTASIPVKSLSVSARDATAREITFSSDGTKLYYLGGTNATIYQYTLTTPFNISTATYATKTLLVSGQEASPQGLAFSSDGTKAYVTGISSDNIRQYTLTTPWDISTGSYASKTLSVLIQDTTSTALQFSSDGTKAYILGDTNNTIYQYTLTTAWDISTGSYASKSFSVGTQETAPTGMVFDANGTKVYIVGTTNDSIYQYSLGTAWDISTATYASKAITVSFYETTLAGLAINADGTRVYVIGTINNTIYQIDLGVAYDIATANIGFTSVLTQDTTAQALSFKDDGTRMYVLGITNDRIFEYNLSVAWQVSTAVYSRQSQILTETAGGGISFSSDGTKFYVAGQTFDRVYQYNLTNAWDVSASTIASSAYIGYQESITEGLTFSSDGLNVYVLGSTNDTIYQYPLETAWNIETANTGFISTGSQDGFIEGFCFNSDGTKIFMVGSANTTKYFHQYDLTKAYLVSSGTFTKSSGYILSNTEANPRGITINPAGTKLFVVGSTNDSIYEFGLSTPNDVGTMTLNVTRNISYATSEPVDIRFNNDGKILYVLTTSFVYGFDLNEAYNLASINAGSLYVGGQDTTPYGIQFSTDGDKLYVLGQTNDRIMQYNLSYNWYISSASYSSKLLTVTTQEPTPFGFTFGDSGNKVYVIGSTNNTVYQYNLSTTWDIGTATYANKFINLNVYDIAWHGMKFNDTGTKLFIVGQTNDRILEFSLSTAWDISTIQTGFISISGAETGITGIDFDNTGTKMFIIGTQNSKITQYDLSTSWLLNTATLNSTDFLNISSLTVGFSDTSIQSINFNQRGTKLYVYGGTNNRIYQFNTAFT